MKKITMLLVLICVLFLGACDKEPFEKFDKDFINRSEPISWDVTEEFIMEIYDTIIFVEIDEPGDCSFYQAKSITFDDLDSYYTLRIVFNALPVPILSDANMSFPQNGFDGYLDKSIFTDEIVAENPYVFARYQKRVIIPVKTFDEKAEELFGPDAILEHKTFAPFSGGICEFEEDCYIYSVFEGGGLGDNYLQNYLIKAESLGEYLYLYDKYAKYKVMNNQNDTKHALYSDCYYKNLIAEFEGNLVYDITYLGNGVFDRKHNQSFYEKYGDIMQPYKHTFKKAEDGSYYWISTEMISEIP